MDWILFFLHSFLEAVWKENNVQGGKKYACLWLKQTNWKRKILTEIASLYQKENPYML